MAKPKVVPNLTSAQRTFYDGATAGVKATITRKRNEIKDNKKFAAWFKRYKNQHSK